MNVTKPDKTILKYIAPCSMFCSTCTGCQYGEISHHTIELLRLLEGHEEFLDKNLKKEYRHKLDEFRLFQKKLMKYAYPKCGGCRDKRANSCCIKNCIIPECVKEHNIDFCYECQEFPCDKVNEDIYKKSTIEKWLNGNNYIKDYGVEKYYEENKLKPHYVNYKKDRKN